MSEERSRPREGEPKNDGAEVVALHSDDSSGVFHGSIEHAVSSSAEDLTALNVAEAGPGIARDQIDPSVESVAHQPQPMSVSEVKRLALRGVAVLALRTFGLRIITFAGNVMLARLLAPEAFGLFTIVSFIVAISSFLADMGIGAALVQRKEELTDEDLRTAFTLSFLVDLFFTLLLLALAPVLVTIYKLEPRYALAVRLLSITILLSTFATIPHILLERHLKFARDSISDMAASFVYITTSVVLAYSGLHFWSFVIASIVSRVVNSVLLNVFAFWRPRFGMTRASAKRLLSFGLPYQATGMLLQVKDSFVPTFVAVAAGASAVGYLNWAIGMATNPLFLLAIVSKVTFPAYARLQHDPRALRRALEESIKWVSITVFPVAGLLMALAPDIVTHVYSPKWRPGLPAFYFMCIPVIASSYSTVLVSALYGLGRAKQVLKLTLIWTIAGWGLSVPFTLWFGFTGFTAAMALVSLLSYLSVREIKRVIEIRFARTWLRLLSSAAVPSLLVWWAAPHVVHDVGSLAALGFAGGCGYLLILALSGDLWDAKRLVKGVLKRA